MRKEYRKAVEVLFTKRLARDLPGFEKVRIDSPLIFGGERVYAWYFRAELFRVCPPRPQPSGTPGVHPRNRVVRARPLP